MWSDCAECGGTWPTEDVIDGVCGQCRCYANGGSTRRDVLLLELVHRKVVTCARCQRELPGPRSMRPRYKIDHPKWWRSPESLVMAGLTREQLLDEYEFLCRTCVPYRKLDELRKLR